MHIFDRIPGKKITGFIIVLFPVILLAGDLIPATPPVAQIIPRIDTIHNDIRIYNYSRTEQGKQYLIYCRKKWNLDAAEEIILDHNVLAESYEYYDIGSLSV